VRISAIAAVVRHDMRHEAVTAAVETRLNMMQSPLLFRLRIRELKGKRNALMVKAPPRRTDAGNTLSGWERELTA